MWKKDYSWNPRACICENDKYFKSIADGSVIVCDKVINATDSVPTNVTNNIPTNITNTISKKVVSTVSINSDDKKVRCKMHFYVLHTILLVIIVLFIIATICYHRAIISLLTAIIALVLKIVRVIISIT